MIYSPINVQEYDQFLRDRNNLMDENNDLNESYASLTTDYGEDIDYGGKNADLNDHDRTPRRYNDTTWTLKVNIKIFTSTL